MLVTPQLLFEDAMLLARLLVRWPAKSNHAAALHPTDPDPVNCGDWQGAVCRRAAVGRNCWSRVVGGGAMMGRRVLTLNGRVDAFCLSETSDGAPVRESGGSRFNRWTIEENVARFAASASVHRP